MINRIKKAEEIVADAQEKASDIIKKVIEQEGDYYKSSNFSGLVSPIHYFDKDGQLSSSWKGYSKKKSEANSIKYYLNKQLESSGFGWIRLSDIPKGQQSINLHKIYFPEAGGSGNDPIVLGKPFYGEPGSVCSQTYLLVGYDPDRHNFTKEQCENIITYMKTRFFRYMVSIKKNTQHNPAVVFQFVPLQDWSHVWTDEELYKKYSLSKEQIEYIESLIKPMDSEALFNSDDLLDPNFGEFNLLEHGVKIGDKILYNNEIEVTVCEDNKVEYAGEQYTLAQFTSKFMPRNKHSKSGVIQGPKYFSYNGVSLYQLKESFLGGQK